MKVWIRFAKTNKLELTLHSRVLPACRFPSDIEIRPLDNSVMAKTGIVHRLPLAEVVPIGRDSCREGPRGHRWRSDAPATLQVMIPTLKISLCIAFFTHPD